MAINAIYTNIAFARGKYSQNIALKILWGDFVLGIAALAVGILALLQIIPMSHSMSQILGGALIGGGIIQILGASPTITKTMKKVFQPKYGYERLS